MSAPRHQFVVPAYGQSPYLRDCLRSLAEQLEPSPILLSTSTPFDGLESMAREFGAELHVHGPNRGIVHDWNEGMSRSSATWVTIAHQDDLYLPAFSQTVMAAAEAVPDPILVFTDYAEILESGRIRRNTRLLKIKQLLLQVGFLGRTAIRDRWSKLNTLRFGTPIPCPSVTLRTGPQFPAFEHGFRLNMDWAAWICRAQLPGSFIWVRQELMHHRIHSQSETTDGIAAGHRRNEDLAILQRLWPSPIARMIARTYRIAYSSNTH
jgi:glycosyltransferase involved in cell wall biosynthesis